VLPRGGAPRGPGGAPGSDPALRRSGGHRHRPGRPDPTGRGAPAPRPLRPGQGGAAGGGLGAGLGSAPGFGRRRLPGRDHPARLGGPAWGQFGGLGPARTPGGDPVGRWPGRHRRAAADPGAPRHRSSLASRAGVVGAGLRHRGSIGHPRRAGSGVPGEWPVPSFGGVGAEPGDRRRHLRLFVGRGVEEERGHRPRLFGAAVRGLVGDAGGGLLHLFGRRFAVGGPFGVDGLGPVGGATFGPAEGDLERLGLGGDRDGGLGSGDPGRRFVSALLRGRRGPIAPPTGADDLGAGPGPHGPDLATLARRHLLGHRRRHGRDHALGRSSLRPGRLGRAPGQPAGGPPVFAGVGAPVAPRWFARDRQRHLGPADLVAGRWGRRGFGVVGPGLRRVARGQLRDPPAHHLGVCLVLRHHLWVGRGPGRGARRTRRFERWADPGSGGQTSPRPGLRRRLCDRHLALLRGGPVGAPTHPRRHLGAAPGRPRGRGGARVARGADRVGGRWPAGRRRRAG
jgi:hypothetical protein